ncbi:hypothetical protein [Pseudomonas baetica]|uniref:hypothetical protein n=1 Tax=Pseudomonas baetica TaxID=674054 RepID=UPI0032177998|nr:hypothetical protein [Pseudomonas baetica]
MSNDYSLPEVLERIYYNQLALEAVLMELTLRVEQRGSAEIVGDIQGALEAVSENAGYIKQSLARLKARGPSQVSISANTYRYSGDAHGHGPVADVKPSSGP